MARPRQAWIPRLRFAGTKIQLRRGRVDYPTVVHQTRALKNTHPMKSPLWPLQLANRHRYPFVFVCGLATAAATALFFPEGRHFEVFLSIAMASAGITHFLYSQHVENTRLFTDLFREFNRRYDKLNRRLNALINNRKDDLGDEDRALLYDYFNLCAEEYLFYHAGYIDKSVWEAWGNGMAIFFADPRVEKLWKKEEGTNSYYGFTPPKPIFTP